VSYLILPRLKFTFVRWASSNCKLAASISVQFLNKLFSPFSRFHCADSFLSCSCKSANCFSAFLRRSLLASSVSFFQRLPLDLQLNNPPANSSSSAAQRVIFNSQLRTPPRQSNQSPYRQPPVRNVTCLRQNCRRTSPLRYPARVDGIGILFF